ncbi:family 78 glycoside hydrolase catalytic domain [Saccharicrinis sp. FJH62]|uniref:family 78 glycoside hydrolase catalytic domain n=1 Tax=Saccharicrinis sp. FJH62 TaxID=3344657 RepID=UPI0035D41278
MNKKKKLLPVLLLISLFFVFGLITKGAVNEKCQPTELSVNFLTRAGQVFLNGYPVNTTLHDAVHRNENFQFTEIAQKKPFFGWVVNSDQENTLQTAYRILLASNLQNLQNDNGDLWDSGKTESDQSLNISYEGNALQANAVYFWKVKTWDNHGNESPFSAVSQFKTASNLVDYETSRYPLQKQDEFPVAVKDQTNNVTFIDFGKDAFGRLRLNLESQTGKDTITIRLGEVVKDGNIDRNPGGTRRFSTYQLALNAGRNTYIIAIRPDRRNTGSRAIHMPAYTGEVTPFRYCEIEGYNGKIEQCDIIREAVFYPFNETDSYFTSSDKVLNQVWELCKYSMKATSFTGVFVDGDRERIPYEADALINQLGYYSVVRDYSIGRYTEEYLIHHATWPTEWILQSVVMAWYDYLYTGNKESLEQFYKDLQAKTLLPLADESGFISTRTGKVTPELLKSIHLNDNIRDIVDWPHTGILGLGKNEKGETDGFVFMDVNTVVNAYHYFALNAMATIAGELGKKEDQEFYASQAGKLMDVFNKELLDKTRGIYVDGIGTDHSSLHSNMFPVAFGLAPKKNVDQISDFIRSRGMACSVYGSQFLMEAVYDNHDSRYGLDLLTSTSERSWYNMIRDGSTISMEAWGNKYKPNQDWNHAWGAAPANIIPRKLMGIEPLEPGFKRIQIKPQPADLEYAKIKCPTIRGAVYVSFTNKPGEAFKLDISVPANTTADVYVPVQPNARHLFLDGQRIKYKKGKGFLKVENVGSGKKTFELK